MRRLILGSALAALLALTLPAVAMAQTGDPADTLMNLDFSTKSKKAGTKKKGRPVSLTIKVGQSTRTGTGQPATSRQLKIALPKEFRWNGKLYPSSKRCDPTAATRAKSTRVCPKGSKVGSGHVTAIASGGNLVEELDVSVFVTTGADLGLFLDSAPTAPALDSHDAGRQRERRQERLDQHPDTDPGACTGGAKRDPGTAYHDQRHGHA